MIRGMAAHAQEMPASAALSKSGFRQNKGDTPVLSDTNERVEEDSKLSMCWKCLKKPALVSSGFIAHEIHFTSLRQHGNTELSKEIARLIVITIRPATYVELLPESHPSLVDVAACLPAVDSWCVPLQ